MQHQSKPPKPIPAAIPIFRQRRARPAPVQSEIRFFVFKYPQHLLSSAVSAVKSPCPSPSCPPVAARRLASPRPEPSVPSQSLMLQGLPAHVPLQRSRGSRSSFVPPQAPLGQIPALLDAATGHTASLTVFYCQPAQPRRALEEVGDVFWVQRCLDVQFSGFAVLLHDLQPQGWHLCFLRAGG